MRAYPTTTVSVLRGAQADEFGDQVDANTVVASALLASIHETTQDVFDAASSTARTIRKLTGRMANGTDVRVSDRIRDERTGQVYGIANVYTPTNPAFPADVRLDLESIS